TQTGRAFIAILERVHLLRDDVGVAANSAGKQLGRLKDRRSDFVKAERAKNLVSGSFDPVPQGGLGGGKGTRAAEGLKFGFGGHGLVDAESYARCRPKSGATAPPDRCFCTGCSGAHTCQS